MTSMSSENPYSAPSVTAAPPDFATPAQIIPATHGPRFLNMIIDQIVVGVMNVGVNIMLIIAFGGTNAAGEPDAGIPGVIANLALMIAYYTLSEGIFGKTLGKLATGTRVVGMDGLKIPMGKAFTRSLCRLIPFEAFSFLGSNARGWHDSITKTWVIKGR